MGDLPLLNFEKMYYPIHCSVMKRQIFSDYNLKIFDLSYLDDIVDKRYKLHGITIWHNIFITASIFNYAQ